MPVANKRRLALVLTGTLLIVGASLAWWLLSRSPEEPAASVERHQPHVGAAPSQQDDKEQLYTCSMHPSVIQEQPGSCPICGMDLTPVRRGAAGGQQSTKQAQAAHGGGGEQSSSGKAQRKVKYWVAPMDPSYIRDEPGKSPMGMDLVPVYEEQDPGKGVVAVDPVMVQSMGVRVAPVERADLVRQVRTLGEVVVAEDLVGVVNLKYSGWVKRLYVDQTGMQVKKGQPLLAIYSPELVATQEEFLLALRATGPDSPLTRAARTRLELWDLSKAAIARIARQGKVQRTLTISSPRSGYLLHKDVVEGAEVKAGQDLFRIGKLEDIWVQAQVYEFDAPWVQVGQPATMELSFAQGRLYEGRVSYIYPTLDKTTRTLQVRLKFENPGLRLKPGMFATVRIETRKRQDVLVVPTEAILRSGERNVVFVALGGGHYQPRQVVTGLSGVGHLTQIRSGLKEGERVVVSGQFLLDSESQLQEAMDKLLADRLEAPAAGEAGQGEPHGEAHPGERKKE